MKKMAPSLTKVILLAIFAACLSFWLASVFFQFPFIADDYMFLSLANSDQGLRVSDFSSVLTRIPLWCFLCWILFNSKLFSSTWALMYVFYTLHACTFVLLVKYVLRVSGQKFLDNKYEGVLLIILISTFIHYPMF